jgi:hypothetical protein
MAGDRTHDALFSLNGVSYVIEGPYWVKFEVKEVAVTAERPHGLDYSFTLHDGDGERILGFDNAHAITEVSGPGARTRVEYDHKHRGERVRFYDFTDAATLIVDFWAEVDKVLLERSS